MKHFIEFGLQLQYTDRELSRDTHNSIHLLPEYHDDIERGMWWMSYQLEIQFLEEESDDIRRRNLLFGNRKHCKSFGIYLVMLTMVVLEWGDNYNSEGKVVAEGTLEWFGYWKGLRPTLDGMEVTGDPKYQYLEKIRTSKRSYSSWTLSTTDSRICSHENGFFVISSVDNFLPFRPQPHFKHALLKSSLTTDHR